MKSLLNRQLSRMASSLASKNPLIAVCQLNSKHDVEENFQIAVDMMKRAKERDAEMIFFPESFDFIGRNREENESVAFEENGEFINRYRQMAKKLGLWLSLGGFHHKEPSSDRKPFNTHIILDNDGNIRGKYQKVHLFDLDLPGKVRLMESEFSSAGLQLAKPVETPIGNVAMSICYDLRFPELALWNRFNGAHVLTYPSAFTLNTGLAHWEALLRARAIETQCYVVAAAQTGVHNSKRISYGHAMVVDPWGAVIAQCSENVDICFCEISKDYLNGVRTNQPVFAHRRSDLYSLIVNEREKIDSDGFFFGDSNLIKPEVIFYQSAHSFAFINRSPVLPGHVLICPKRPVERLMDLEDYETADLFIVAKRIQRMLESHYNTSSSSVCVQDGPEAGQTIKHVHVHVLPRKASDFGGNPDILYHELAKHDKPENKKSKMRSSESMKEEADLYRNLLNVLH